MVVHHRLLALKRSAEHSTPNHTWLASFCLCARKISCYGNTKCNIYKGRTKPQIYPRATDSMTLFMGLRFKKGDGQTASFVPPAVVAFTYWIQELKSSLLNDHRTFIFFSNLKKKNVFVKLHRSKAPSKRYHFDLLTCSKGNDLS